MFRPLSILKCKIEPIWNPLALDIHVIIQLVKQLLAGMAGVTRNVNLDGQSDLQYNTYAVHTYNVCMYVTNIFIYVYIYMYT